MPLPKTATTIKGGCNCGAIRYKINVPDFKDRVLHPAYPINTGNTTAANNTSTASASTTASTTGTSTTASTSAAADGAGSTVNHADDDDPDAIKFPFIATCHCNDCRAATAGIVGAWICCPASTVMVSAISRSSEVAREAGGRKFKGKTFDDDGNNKGGTSAAQFSTEATGKLRQRTQDPSSTSSFTTSSTTSSDSSSESSSSPPYRPGMEMLLPTPHSRDTFIHFHHSSNARTRTFCGRCGTPIAYNIWPMAHGLPDILDIVLATVDRGPVPEARLEEGPLETLETLEPDVQLWWDYGVPWVKKMSSGLTGVPRYANWRVNKPMVD